MPQEETSESVLGDSDIEEPWEPSVTLQQSEGRYRELGQAFRWSLPLPVWSSLQGHCKVCQLALVVYVCVDCSNLTKMPAQ